MEEETPPEKAIRLVTTYLIKQQIGLSLEERANVHLDNIKITWFCKTLKNWKAMVADLNPDGMFFEVTHNSDKQETYIDAYKKHENVCMAE